MGKHLIYIAGAFAIVIVLCSITTATTKKTSSQRSVVTNKIDDVRLDDDATVTTNIWDYLRSQKEDDTIGDSSQGEPDLTIVLE